MPEVKKKEAKTPENDNKAPEIVTKMGVVEKNELYDRKMVTGTFHYKDKKGGIFRCGGMRKYKGEKLNPIYMVDGQTYTIPRWMADWFNGADINDPEKNPTKTPGARKLLHQDQWNDLQKKRPLGDPQVEHPYSFTPIAAW